MLESLKQLFRKKNIQSSFSDNGKYPSFCKNASENNEIFKTFRSNPVYDCIVDVISYEQGMLFYDDLKNSKDFLNNIKEFKKNDLHGSPRMFEYPETGEISPATLRYIKILYDIEKHFGSLDNKTVMELGVGYGGQARMLNLRHDVKKYNLIDLPEVTALASKYLKNFKSYEKFKFLTKETILSDNIDLFISNYAFSELNRDLQEFYLENIILKSKNGYMIYNHINPKEFNSFTKEEILNFIPNSKAIFEEPKTSEKNYIVIWKE